MTKAIGIFVYLSVIITGMLVSHKEIDESKNDIRIGKEITVVVEEHELIDAVYLKSALDGEATIGKHFQLLDPNELGKMIDYMEKNNLKLAPGKYTFNQAWKFDNGKMVTHAGEFVDVFEFCEIN